MYALTFDHIKLIYEIKMFQQEWDRLSKGASICLKEHCPRQYAGLLLLAPCYNQLTANKPTGGMPCRRD